MKKEKNEAKPDYLSEFNLVHFKKVNLFGLSKVGKKTLISYIQHYSNKDINFEIKKEEDEEENNAIDKNNIINTNLVEDVKRMSITYYETKKLDINLYITNIDNMELIQNNLDTLLSNSECAIFMVDISKAESFAKVSELMPKVYEKMKANIDVGDVPLFFISNKIDLEMKREVSGFEVKELIDHYSAINNYEISLNLEKNAKDDTINDFIIKLCHTISEQEKKYTYKYDSLNLVKINEPMKIVKESNLTKYAENSLNLLLLGSASVGKTSFVQKLFKNQFKEEMLSTLGIDIESTIVETCGSLLKIELWDTVGQERLRSLPQKYFSKGDGFFLLYDVNDKKSFEDITGWIKDIRKARGSANEDNFEKKSNDEVMVLIGNKIDKIGQRQVQRQEAVELANKYNLSYYETSCKQGINLYEILCDVIFQASANGRKEAAKVVLLKRKDQAKNLNTTKKKCC